MNKRFSPEFVALLRKRVGKDRFAFIHARKDFMNWRRSECQVIVISPFCASYVAPSRVDKPECACDSGTECYHAPFNSLSSPPLPPRVSEPILMEEDSPFRLPPGRHIVPILFRRRAVEVNDSPEERPPTIDEPAVLRVRRAREFMAAYCIEIPRDQWPAWLESEPGL